MVVYCPTLQTALPEWVRVLQRTRLPGSRYPNANTLVSYLYLTIDVLPAYTIIYGRGHTNGPKYIGVSTPYNQTRSLHTSLAQTRYMRDDNTTHDLT